jgi:hypothetical protein
MKLTTLIQYHGHVIHAGGHTTYRRVTVELTAEQAAALQLREDEDYGTMFIEHEEVQS